MKKKYLHEFWLFIHLLDIFILLNENNFYTYSESIDYFWKTMDSNLLIYSY